MEGLGGLIILALIALLIGVALGFVGGFAIF